MRLSSNAMSLAVAAASGERLEDSVLGVVRTVEQLETELQAEVSTVLKASSAALSGCCQLRLGRQICGFDKADDYVLHGHPRLNTLSNTSYITCSFLHVLPLPNEAC